MPTRKEKRSLDVGHNDDPIEASVVRNAIRVKNDVYPRPGHDLRVETPGGITLRVQETRPADDADADR